MVIRGRPFDVFNIKMTSLTMKKVPPDVRHLTEMDHLPSVRRLRVQVITNSKGYVELNLNHRGLRIVPPETFQLTNTQVLRLDHNYIDYLPTMVAYLRGLRVLDLQRNVLVHLPETLVNCKHLAELRLTGNRLATLPRSFGGLKNLRVLEIGENQLEQLPHEVGLLHSLRTLDLHSNKLWHLPFSLQELRHLISLNLSDNTFDHVPLVVTKITSVRALNLSKNRLGSLPLDFDSLKGLRELNLSHNKMMSISSVLVTFGHLKYLSLASNSLKFLPSQMSQLQNLRVLHLQGNELRHVPSCLRRLRYYNVSSNKITAFSVEGMRSLVSLTASKNRLETMPRGLFKLKQIKSLALDANSLIEIGEDIAKLTQLRVLNLSNNNLHKLPKALHELPLLQNFNIKGNYNLNKRHRKHKDIETKLNEENERFNNEHGKRKLLHRGGALRLKDEGKEDEDDDDDDDDDDNFDDEDEFDEGIRMTEGGKKLDTSSFMDILNWKTDVNRNMPARSKYRGRHNEPSRISARSAKSLDDLVSVGRRQKYLNTDNHYPHSHHHHHHQRHHSHHHNHHHQIAGELSGRNVKSVKSGHSSRNGTMQRAHQNIPSGTQRSSKMFLGRGVALPSGSRATTLKKMTSSNPFVQSQGVKQMTKGVNKKKESESVTEKKSKFNKSVKGLKELLFGKSKNKSKFPTNIDPDIVDNKSRYIDSTMKTSNSVQLPVEYTMDEVDRGWRSRPMSEVNSARMDTLASRSRRSATKDRHSLVNERGYVSHDDEEEERRHKLTHHRSESDVRDWKSLSHGYGSWRSRTPRVVEESEYGSDVHYRSDFDVEAKMIPSSVRKRTDNNVDYFPFRENKSKLNRKKSYSSDTVASDFTYQKFGGKPDRAPSRQSSNASRYRIEKRNHQNNNYVTTYGNDRYSAMSDRGSMPRPSSRNKYLGQWYGPDYESTLTTRSDDETDGRSYDYSVRGAKASFVTETTLGHRDNKYGHQKRPGSASFSNHDYQFRPQMNSIVGRHQRRNHSSVESLSQYHRNKPHLRGHENVPLASTQSYEHLPSDFTRHHPPPQPFISNNGGLDPNAHYYGSYTPSALSNFSCRSDSNLFKPHHTGLDPNNNNNNSEISSNNHWNIKRSISHNPQFHDNQRGSFGFNRFINEEDENDYFDEDCDDNVLFRNNNNNAEEINNSNTDGWVSDSVITDAHRKKQPTYNYEPHHNRSNSYEYEDINRSHWQNRPHVIATTNGVSESDETTTQDGRSSNNYNDNQAKNRQSFNWFTRSKSFPDFDNVLATNERQEELSPTQHANTTATDSKINASANSTLTRYPGSTGNIDLLDDNFALKKKTQIPKSRSMDSLLLEEQDSNGRRRAVPFGKDLTPLPGSYGTLARKHVMAKQNGDQLNRTDYTLLGVCNQIETMLNKNLLQPVIGFKGSHKFEDKTIQEKSKGVWRLGDSFDQDEGVDNAADDDINDDSIIDDVERGEKKVRVELEYTQPQAFKVTSTGGQFVTCERPEVKFAIPAHSVDKSLQITIQMLNISSQLFTQAKKLNHFIDNIIAIGPVVYIYVAEKPNLNSPASLTFPAPASIKGAHLTVLSVKRDNSCVPCNSGYRSSKLEVTVSAWNFIAKVAVLTQAKCKYKACKSVETLLQCIGANQV